MKAGRDEARSEDLHRRLRQWRREHPRASFDEIEDAVQQEISALQAQLVAEVIGTGQGESEPAAEREEERPVCPACGGPLQRSGQRTRTVLSRLGQPIPLERPYFVCPACGAGLFPPG